MCSRDVPIPSSSHELEDVFLAAAGRGAVRLHVEAIEAEIAMDTGPEYDRPE